MTALFVPLLITTIYINIVTVTVTVTVTMIVKSLLGARWPASRVRLKSNFNKKLMHIVPF